MGLPLYVLEQTIELRKGEKIRCLYSKQTKTIGKALLTTLQQQ